MFGTTLALENVRSASGLGIFTDSIPMVEKER